MERINITIPLRPVTKKNSQQIFINQKTGRPFIAQSKPYKQYEKACGLVLAKYGNLKIDYPINLKAIYYLPTRRRVDLTNLHQALQDILVKYGVLEDDNMNIVAGHDGSRWRYDKTNPRTEIEITRMEE